MGNAHIDAFNAADVVGVALLRDVLGDGIEGNLVDRLVAVVASVRYRQGWVAVVNDADDRRCDVVVHGTDGFTQDGIDQ